MSIIQQDKSLSNSPFRGLGGMRLGNGEICLTDTGKRFNRDWIFRHLTYTFETGRTYAITGPNGSGKSTLLQAIAGSMYLSEGSLEYRISNIEYRTGQPVSGVQSSVGSRQSAASSQYPTFQIDIAKVYQYLSIAAPYLDLVEEMTAKEFLHFHAQFKPLLGAVSINEILSLTGLEKAADKQIRYFSSGMKQRLKLAQAVFSDVPVLLLDEPCTNLDASGYQLYHDLINNYCLHKLVIVSSNDEQEIDFCAERLNIIDYK
jgi:ABC-type multidrug transport system ATPase subunit